jgi:hypothetical protein
MKDPSKWEDFATEVLEAIADNRAPRGSRIPYNTAAYCAAKEGLIQHFLTTLEGTENSTVRSFSYVLAREFKWYCSRVLIVVFFECCHAIVAWYTALACLPTAFSCLHATALVLSCAHCRFLSVLPCLCCLVYCSCVFADCLFMLTCYCSRALVCSLSFSLCVAMALLLGTALACLPTAFSCLHATALVIFSECRHAVVAWHCSRVCCLSFRSQMLSSARVLVSLVMFICCCSCLCAYCLFVLECWQAITLKY